ncbi:MAG TPA: 50S ribosomal protein L19 [Candidatus Levybacteria bacterium]|nr:50S ribosomal protein L19 [Candidatus Levybacteria bacterium]
MDAQIRVGDTIQVSQKVQEAKRERIVAFKGKLIKSRGKDENRMITVRNFVDGVYVDRIYPVNLPTITEIKLIEKPKKVVRKAKLLKLPTK